MQPVYMVQNLLPGDCQLGVQPVYKVSEPIVRPANRDWACQTVRCHRLSNKTKLNSWSLVYSKSGVIAYVRFTRVTN